MLAELVANNEIPKRAERIDSPAMLAVLGYLQQKSFLFYSDRDHERTAILRRLKDLGLVDLAYEGSEDGKLGKPFIWVSNGNGTGVIKYFEETPLTIHPSTEPTLATLSEWDHQVVLRTVQFLGRKEPASWPSDLAIPLKSEKSMYLLRITPNLRAFVTILDSGGMELTGIVREETLRMFQERQGNGTANR